MRLWDAWHPAGALFWSLKEKECGAGRQRENAMFVADASKYQEEVWENFLNFEMQT